MGILAIQAIQKMRGGSQSQLMLGDDRNLWVVKFQNNPQGSRILANEMFVSACAKRIGLSTPDTEIVEVTSTVIENSPDMRYERVHGISGRYSTGRHFGSKYVGSLMPGAVFDYLSDEKLAEVTNLSEFAGILCVDKWAANRDGRQAVFARQKRSQSYKGFFIDHGFCLNACEWTFLDNPLSGRYGNRTAYRHVTGWDSFQPWLTRLEEISLADLWQAAEGIPTEWYGNFADLEKILDRLISRRSRIRDLILSYRDSDLEPFPSWVRSSSVNVL